VGGFVSSAIQQPATFNNHGRGIRKRPVSVSCPRKKRCRQDAVQDQPTSIRLGGCFCFHNLQNTIMLLPLHKLLGLSSLENVTLVVDNAKSPINPVSLRKKGRKNIPSFVRSYSCSDTKVCSRWLSHSSKLSAGPLQEAPPFAPNLSMEPPKRKTSPTKKLSSSSSRLVPVDAPARLAPIPFNVPISFPKLPVRSVSPKSQSPRVILRKVQSLRVFQNLTIVEEAN